MSTGRANRAGLAILGLLLVVGGGLVLARGLRAFPQNWAPAGVPLVDQPVTDFFATFSPWIWWAFAVLAVIVALVGLRWLVAQGRTETMGEIRVGSGPDGQTTVDSQAVASAASAELSALPAVRTANARLAGDGDQLLLRLRVAADDRVPISVLRHQLTTVTVPHLQQALGADRLQTVARVELERAAPQKRVLQ
ncbi:hypothetical protein AB0B45_06580 [Nonomuraea sp. NPDC049152]|uniref:hypothetical protein n=1 Tax=Nonomuraea sp. NPDC049152 TaxID=3154350 RepID=UPI00341091BA